MCQIPIKILKPHATPNSRIIHQEGAEKLIQLASELYLAKAAVPSIRISAEDITSDYRFLLRVVNSAFTTDTDEYYAVQRQFRRLAQGHCWRELYQLTKTANFEKLHI